MKQSPIDSMLSYLNPGDSCDEIDTSLSPMSSKKKHGVYVEDSFSQDLESDALSCHAMRKKKKKRRKDIVLKTEDDDLDGCTQPSQIDAVPSFHNSGDSCDEIDMSLSPMSSKKKHGVYVEDSVSQDLESDALSCHAMRKKKKKKRKRDIVLKTEDDDLDGCTQPSQIDAVPSFHNSVESCDEFCGLPLVSTKKKHRVTIKERVSQESDVFEGTKVRKKKKKRKKGFEITDEHDDLNECTQQLQIDPVPSSINPGYLCDEIVGGQAHVSSKKKHKRVTLMENVSQEPDVENCLEVRKKKKKRKKHIDVTTDEGDPDECKQQSLLDLSPSSVKPGYLCDEIGGGQALVSSKKKHKRVTLMENVSQEPETEVSNYPEVRKKKKKKRKKYMEVTTDEGNLCDEIGGVQALVSSKKKRKRVTLMENVSQEPETEVSNYPEVRKKKKKKRKKHMEVTVDEGDSDECKQQSLLDFSPSSVRQESEPSGRSSGDVVTTSWTKGVGKCALENSNVWGLSEDHDQKVECSSITVSKENCHGENESSSERVCPEDEFVLYLSDNSSHGVSPKKDCSLNHSEETENKGRNTLGADRSENNVHLMQNLVSGSDDKFVGSLPLSDCQMKADLMDGNSKKIVGILEDLLTNEEFSKDAYSEVLETISESKAPSKDVIKNLKELSIEVDWDVHPTHKVESRIAHLPTEEEMSQLLCLEESMKKGRYLPAEDKIIKQNWNEFSQKYGFENPKDFFIVRMHNNYLLKPNEFKNFVRYLGRGLPNRTLNSIFMRFRRLFQDNLPGRLPAELKTVFKKHVECYGKKYNGIKTLLNKSAHCLSATAGYLAAGSLKAKAFKSLEEKTELFKAILKVTNSKSYEDLKGKRISWNKVSRILNVRTESCHKYWTRYLSGYMALKEPLLKRVVTDKLIKVLKALNVNNSKEVKWDEISPRVYGLPPGFLWHALRVECSRLTIKFTDNHWREAIERLCEEVGKKHQKKLYPCCKYVDSKIVYVDSVLT